MKNMCQKKDGFTLVELIVVIGIIGILATLGMSSYANIQERARTTKAIADMTDIKKALLQLQVDTNQLPQHYDPSICTANNETFLNAPTAGLLSTDGNFPNWQGPYIEPQAVIDQWGNPYYYDPDYLCHTNVKGCEDLPNGTGVRAMHTLGRDGIQGYNSGQDVDNVVMVLCK